MNPKIDQQYWMNIAKQIATASTCRADVGCVLVYKNMIVGHGYVGSVHGDTHCNEKDHVLVKTDVKGSTRTGTTCIRTVHAEVNAVLKCTVRGSESDGWLECYCTYQPCLDCTKILMQIGVRSIYYLHTYQDDWREQFLDECELIAQKFHSPEEWKNKLKFVKVLG